MLRLLLLLPGGWFLHVPSFLLEEGFTAIVDVRPKMICNSVQLREIYICTHEYVLYIRIHVWVYVLHDDMRPLENDPRKQQYHISLSLDLRSGRDYNTILLAPCVQMAPATQYYSIIIRGSEEVERQKRPTGDSAAS